MNKVFLILLSTLVLMLASCQKSNDNPFDIGDGAGTGEVVTNKGTYSFGFGVGYHIIDENKTIISIAPTATSGATQYILMTVPGKAATQYQLSSTAYMSLLIEGKLYYSVDGSGSIRITAYGPVGGRITGSFTGTFVNGANNDDKLTVTSASFSVIRLEDELYDDDDDDDDDNIFGFNYAAADIDLYAGESYSYSLEKIDGQATYTLNSGMHRIDFATALYDDDYDGIIFGFAGGLEVVNSTSGQVVNFNINPETPTDNVMMVYVENKVYFMSGSFKIDKFAGTKDQLFEFSGQGILHEPVYKEAVGDITNIRIKVVRTI
ncbi:MAG: hypothetical protein KIT33_08530 [Candidatus Kapabacteria bacterium]|nr:hypothetical protein [Ignavibacteriota bacterium]MCW5885001.1 hypothetical protein [Candidatus Kapabacteria bacterium]